jgi:Fic family protein
VREDDFPATARGGARRVVGADYVAYFPATLPRSVSYDAELVSALERATAALHRLAGVGRLLPNPNLLILPYVRIEAVVSSRIEGTQSDVVDLLKYEVTGQPDKKGDVDDVREVQNYVVALNHGLERLAGGFPLSMRLMREVHERLMTGVRGGYATPGEFRRSQNWIGGSSPSNAAFVPPPVDAMGQALDDLERFLHEDDLPLLIRLALAHYQFEVIHPFLDGNGRLGRLLIPLVLVARRVLTRPLLYLSVFFERNRAEYYDLLMSTSRTGDLKPWLQFFLSAVATQASDAEERTVRLVELHNATRSRLQTAGATLTTVRAADVLFSTPFVTVRSLSEELDVSAPTARAALQSLVALGDVVELADGHRRRTYSAPAILQAVYGTVVLSDEAGREHF